MPNPHYQRVLEQDQMLPAPLRWLSRAMSSWRTIGILGVFVVGYVAAAHVPVGGRYIWQWRIFDTTQHTVLTWWPLLAAAWLLAAAVLWSAMRRLPWRTDNLGAFVAVLGLAMILVSQSWAFRSQSVGVAAVPITPSTGNAQADALSLNYTTRYGDTHDRVLVVMVGGAAPITIPLEGLPRWNDAAGEAMPKLKIHDEPKLAAVIGYGTRITTSTYIADGTLIEKEDGTQSPEPTDNGFRDMESLPYPANALLALEIITDLEDGGTHTTTAWLPFEPEGTDSLVPERFFPIEGLGSVGLAFRPASKKLPFALGAKAESTREYSTIYLADGDTEGRLLQPSMFNLNYPGDGFSYAAKQKGAGITNYRCEWLRSTKASLSEHLLFKVSTGSSNPFILAGLITFVLGVVLDRLLDWLGSRSKRISAPDTKPEDDGAAT
ncbi:MAG: hypothetical protein KTR15_15485 [Phycisphaeraceae bacterium]|nr:hypothetical protein [Phycisphaeraceae bacterium]